MDSQDDIEYFLRGIALRVSMPWEALEKRIEILLDPARRDMLHNLENVYGEYGEVAEFG